MIAIVGFGATAIAFGAGEYAGGASLESLNGLLFGRARISVSISIDRANAN